jgi:hypothetical protein
VILIEEPHMEGLGELIQPFMNKPKWLTHKFYTVTHVFFYESH